MMTLYLAEIYALPLHAELGLVYNGKYISNAFALSPPPPLTCIPQTNIPVFNHLLIYQLTLIVRWVFDCTTLHKNPTGASWQQRDSL